MIKFDIYAVVTQLFHFSWILPNYNSNLLILLSKTTNSHSIDLFSPIVLANFKFKIIFKVITDRLVGIIPLIISNEQKGFVKGINIRDCISLASEAINFLHKKSHGGNISLKVDIFKTFDSLNWFFYTGS